jgi:hypothetical protein
MKTKSCQAYLSTVVDNPWEETHQKLILSYLTYYGGRDNNYDKQTSKSHEFKGVFVSSSP